ncbi:MAG: peroxide stress protein YaaA [Candidatus Malihini olakiniferum]
MLSGLYSVLRPLDLMQPYRLRLEMGTRLENKAGKDLYHFCVMPSHSTSIRRYRHKGMIFSSILSDEYFKSVNIKKLNGTLIKPVFLDKKNGKFKVIGFYAKKARGLMSRFIIKNRLMRVEQLQDSNLESYYFAKYGTTEQELTSSKGYRSPKCAGNDEQ